MPKFRFYVGNLFSGDSDFLSDQLKGVALVYDGGSCKNMNYGYKILYFIFTGVSVEPLRYFLTSDFDQLSFYLNQTTEVDCVFWSITDNQTAFNSF